MEILHNGQAIMGSPFFVEIYDPNKIRIEGTRMGTVNERMEFDSMCMLLVVFRYFESLRPTTDVPETGASVVLLCLLYCLFGNALISSLLGVEGFNPSREIFDP